MCEHNAQTKPHRVAAEDIVLAVLGPLAGPLLFWIGQTWPHTSAASSIQTLEYWIALLCGYVGIGLSVLSLVFLISGVGFAVAVKTKNTVIGYWSGLFTPKFLQRIILSVFGLQLMLGSQAFAAAEVPTERAEVLSSPSQAAFMPDVVEVPATTSESSESESTDAPSALVIEDTPTPENAPPTATDTESSSASPVPEPRQSSQVFPDSEKASPSAPATTETALKPMPRQTTTTEGQHETVIDETTRAQLPRGLPEVFMPQKPVPSPYIAAPNPHRTFEDPTFVIKSGDCLWDIAHQELGADATLIQIDQRWRQWWQHNHDVIGEDPHTLVPGTVLHAPDFTH